MATAGSCDWASVMSSAGSPAVAAILLRRTTLRLRLNPHVSPAHAGTTVRLLRRVLERLLRWKPPPKRKRAISRVADTRPPRPSVGRASDGQRPARRQMAAPGQQ